MKRFETWAAFIFSGQIGFLHLVAYYRPVLKGWGEEMLIIPLSFIHRMVEQPSGF